MWYLIKELSTNEYAIRYCESIDQAPITMLCTDGGYSYWAVDINLLTSRISANISYTNFLTIDEMTTDSDFIVFPLPSVSSDIISITSIIEAYPELLI